MQHALGSIRLATLLSCLVFGVVGCNGSDSHDDSTHAPDSTTSTAAGNAQKGPFQPGGSAAAFKLQADGTRRGADVSGDIATDGAFELTGIDWTGPTRLEMTGPFFNEFTGNFSMGDDASATLQSVVTLPGDGRTNVNMFTHFIAARIIHLMGADARFDDARDQARDELATIMGISAAPGTLDLLHDDGDDAHEDDSANLLLFSAATLAAGIGQDGIDTVAADFADDGQINGGGQAAFDAIKQATVDNPDLLATARTNLQGQYSVTPPGNTDGQPPAWTPGAPPAPVAPVAAITTSGPLEVDATQSFDASDSTGDSLTYAWDFGDGGTATGAQTTHVYANADTYTATLTVTDAADRSGTDSLDLTITDVDEVPDPPSASFSVGDNRYIDQALTFDAGESRGANLTYVWDFGDGITANGVEVEHTYTTAKEYLVNLTVEDSAGQTNARGLYLAIGSTRLKLDGEKVTGAAEEGNQFGISIAIDGDTAVIGARYANLIPPCRGCTLVARSRGAASVYTRANDGSWTYQAELTADNDDAQSNAVFGSAVAIAGNTIVIGAPRQNAETSEGLQQNQGAAYVFTRGGGVWTGPLKLTANDGQSNDRFGTSVAIAGDTILVGSSRADIAGKNKQGAVYAFSRASGWAQQAKLTAGDGEAGDAFGAAITLSGDAAGDIAVIGAPEGGPGAAYVFVREADGWHEQTTLAADDGEPDDGLGSSIALADDTMMIGSRNADVTRRGTRADQGAVYVFTRSGDVWRQQNKLTAADGKRFDRFGSSISITGDIAVIGTVRTGVGAGYVFTREDGSWSEQANFVNDDNLSDPGFGRSVVSDGDITVVGAVYGASNEGDTAGAAYFYNTSDLEP